MPKSQNLDPSAYNGYVIYYEHNVQSDRTIQLLKPIV